MLTSGETMFNKTTPKKLSRRDFVRLSALVGAGTVLAACAPQTVEKVITATPGPVVPTATPIPTAAPLPGAAKLGGVLVAARTTDTASLDPHTVPLLVNRQTCSLLYNQLAMVDAKLRVQPVLAESWDLPDSTTVVFNLRQNVKWHDGTNFTSADVVYTFQRNMDATTGSWLTGKLALVKAIEPMGDYKVKVTLQEPNSSFLPAMWQLLIIPASVAKQPKDWLANNAIGTGPWMLKDWKPDSKLSLVKNPNYWKPGLPYMDGVDIVIIPDETSVIAALRTGDVQHAQILDLTNMPLLRTSPDLVVYQTPSMGTNFINLEFRKDAIKDIRVRQAMSLGTDRQAILVGAGGGLGVISGVLPPAMADYWVPPDQLANCKYDPAAAKLLLADYGKPLDIDIITIASNKLMTITAELLADQWKQIGMTTHVVGQDVTVWVDARTKTFDYTVSTNLDFPGADPDDILFDTFDSKGAYSAWGGFTDPDLDKLIDAGRHSTDPQARVTAYKSLQKLIDEKCYVLTTFAPIHVDVTQTRVKNYEGHPSQNMYAFEKTWIES
jgi:peptide/nickel transport system substrate-binding protein